MNQIIGKAVVVIYQQEHGGKLLIRAREAPSRRGIGGARRCSGLRQIVKGQGHGRRERAVKFRAHRILGKKQDKVASAMARGVLSGIGLGAIFSIGVAGAISVLVPIEPARAPEIGNAGDIAVAGDGAPQPAARVSGARGTACLLYTSPSPRDS